MLAVSFILSILLQAILPIFIAFFFIRRYKTEWKLVAIGVLAYLVFQVVQAPLFQLISDTEFYQSQIAPLPSVSLALIVGLVTAILEQGIRTGSFWYVRKNIEDSGRGLTLTAGHGGAESVLIGVQFLINFIFAISISSSGVQSLNLSADESAQLQAQINAFWNLPWFLPLVAAIQRVSLLALQFALGTMVWLAVSRRAWIWLGVSVVWHTAMNTLVVILSASMPDLANSALFVVLGLVNAGIVFFLVRKAEEDPLDMALAKPVVEG